MFTPRTKQTLDFWATVQDVVVEHGPISVEGIRKLLPNKKKKLYELRNTLQSMRLDGYPIETIDGLVCISEARVK